MADFKLTKDVDKVSEGSPLPVDRYVMRITDEPKVEPNAKKKQNLSPEEGAGENIVIKLRVQHDNAEYHGRAFTKYLPLPNKADESKPRNSYTGQSMVDMKLMSIAEWCAAFNGGVAPKGKSVSFEAGAEARVPVEMGPDFRDPEKEVNVIPLGAAPEPV